MSDVYDGLLDEEESRLKSDVRQKDTASPYDAALDDEAQQRQAQLGASLRRAVAIKPDAAAKQQILSSASGLPVPVVERNEDIVALQQRVRELHDLSRTSPVLARQLADPQFAALAHDDAEHLSLVEKMLRTYVGASTRSGLESLLGVGARLADTFNPFTLSEQEAAVLFKDDPAKLLEMRRDSPAMVLTRFSEAMQQASQASMKNLSPEAALDYGKLEYATLDVTKAAWLSPVKVVGDAIQSLPTSLAMAASIYLTRGVAARAEQQALATGATTEAAKVAAIKAAAETMARLSAGSEGVIGYAQQANQTREQANAVDDKALESNPNYQKLITEGFSPEAARVWLSAKAAHESGLMAGTADAIVAYFGGQYIGKIIGEGGRLAPRMLRGAGVESGTEAVQSGLEQLSQNAAIQTNLDPSQNLTDQVLENIVQGFFVGGVTGGAFTGVLGGERKAGEAQRAQLFWQQLQQLAASSKLRERAPNSFGDFVQQAAADGPLTDVYVSGQQLAAVLQQSPNVPVPPSVQAQLSEALRLGGDVRIPIGEYTANLAASDAGAALLQHLKTSPDAMSHAEAQTFYQEQAAQFKQQAERAIAGAADGLQAHAQAEAVRQHFFDQLAQANRFTPEVNNAYAALMRDFYVTMAQRLGITPQEMLQRYPLRVAAENIAGAVMDQSQQDISARLRVQNEREERFRMDSAWSRLMSAPASDKAKIVAEMSPKEAQAHLDRLNAAPGDDPIARAALSARAAEGVKVGALRQDTDGVAQGQWLDARARSEGFSDVADLVAKAPARFETLAAEWRAAHPLEQPSRGQIAFGKDIIEGSLISLLKNADLSTFLHESGHFYLEVLAHVASQPQAPDALVADMNAALKWMGVKSFADWQAMTLEEKRPYHEKFARGFEAYLFEGKSPNAETQSLFSRFRAWLINVYKSLTALNVDLDPEVRRVFDRMLASDQQIGIAEDMRGMAPMFASQKEAGATTAEWEAYLNLGTGATEEAVRSLERRSLADLKWAQNARSRVIADLQAEAEAKRKEIRKEVAAEVEAQPIYQVMRWLTTGEITRDGEEVKALKGYKLDLASVAQVFLDRGVPAKLPQGMTVKQGGLAPSLVAEMFGFSSADELVMKLLNAEPMESVINAMTDQRMLENHGDLVDEQSIGRAADKAVHSEARARAIATELRFLDRVATVSEKTQAGGSVNVLARAARQFAEAIIARKKVKDIKPAQFAAAEARAAKAAMNAKSPLEKATEKRNQLVNNYATRAAHEAAAEVEKALRYLRRFEVDGTRKNLDGDYLDQIDSLLERFDLRQASQAEVQKRASLIEWVEKQREQGFEPTIDKALLAEANRQHYSTLTMEEFRGLVDAVKNIEHLARLKKKLLTAKDQREFAAAVDEITASIEANAKGTARERKASDRGPLVSIGQLFRNFMADHRKFASLAREMDGWKDAGPLWERFVRTMNDAGNFEAVEREKATVELSKILAPIMKEGRLGRKTYIQAIDKSLTREERIGIALNMGNQTNVERVVTGEKWSRPQLNAVLDTLTKEEWDFVQKTWDYLESFRPQIAEKTKRVTGLEPEWVEPTPVVTKYGTLKGGYYPIKYDPMRSSKAEADVASEVQRQMERGLYVRAQTRRGHLEERVKSTGRPMRYDFGSVISTHVDQVIHDLAWHEWLIDANRLLRSSAIDGAIRDHYGPEKLRAMKDMLRDIAVGDIGAQTAGDRVLNYLRKGATISGLGWRLTTSLMQPLGLTQSMVRIGPKWVMKGAMHWFGDAVTFSGAMEKITEKSDFMRLRAKTMQREINEIRNTVSGHDSRLEASYFYLIQKMQLVADVPTWWGSYEKAMHQNGMNESKAVALADQAVIDAQGSGQIKDLSGVQRGSPAWKLFTNFYSFFNTTYNLTRESVGRTNFKSVPSVALLAADMALLYSIPALLGTLMKAALKGDWDDQDKFVRRLIADQLNYLFGTVVVVRELGSAIQAAMGQGGADYQGPASVRFFVAVAKLAKQIEQGEADAGFWKALNETAGTAFHYPAGQINSTADGIAALYNGETKNPGVLATGAPKP